MDWTRLSFGLKPLIHLLSWLCVWAFWLFATFDFHPDLRLALITTTSLILAYAGAYYLIRLVLVPKFYQKGQMTKYVCLLLLWMTSFTGLALLMIRLSYIEALGPDPDPWGAAKHFVLDLFGMTVHLFAATLFQTAANPPTGKP